MKRSWTITLLRHEQPTDAAWLAAGRFARAWNARGSQPFSDVQGMMWQIAYGQEGRAEVERLTKELRALEASAGARFHLAWRDALEDDDYAKADLVEVLGVDLEIAPPLVLNGDAALAPGEPCPACGWRDAFDSALREPLVIDMARLGAPAAGGEAPAERGWDAVNLPNGGLLVSRGFLSVLEASNARGWRPVPVIDGATGRPSDQAASLAAARAILAPCPEHTTIDGEPFCPSCGTAYGDLEGYFWARSGWIGDDEVVSRHPGRASMLHFSQRVYRRLMAAGLNGPRRNDIMMVCPHD